jgi:hypothetical protein
MPVLEQTYSINIFINCPFDDEYKPLLDAVIFTVQIAGFIPRTAREASNAADIRINKILKIISQCKYGIHDLSRTELSKNKLPRFNMPFELGLDIACKKFGNVRQKQKRLLIMDKNPHRYLKFISDIRGQDIEEHNKSIKQIILKVRNWISTESKRTTIPGGEYIYKRYRKFRKDLPALCDNLHLTVEELTFNEFVDIAGWWLQETEV